MMAAAMVWRIVLAWAVTALGALCARADEVRASADFGQFIDGPIVKDKLGVFNSGIVPVARYERDARLIGEVRPDSLRIDLGWGGHWAGWSREPIQPDPNIAAGTRCDFAEMDRIAAVLRREGVWPYWSYCYVPDPLQPAPRAWRGPIRDLAGWGRVLAGSAAHYRRAGDNPAGFQEVYNEPDNRDFFVGTRDDYLAMYEAGARAMRSADGDALVGGPALAFSAGWIDPFLDRVIARKLPLDFFSFHFYPGVPYPHKTVGGVIDMVNQRLARHPELRTAELHLNEYNAYKIDYPVGGPQDHYRLASAFLNDMSAFLDRPTLTRVYWAQFQDSGHGNYSGMISLDGHRKAVFNAYRIYTMMPVDRCRLAVDGTAAADVGGMASAAEDRAGLVLWNRATSTAHHVAATLNHLSFDRGSLRVFRIDAQHASWGDHTPSDRLDMQTPAPALAGHSAVWSGDLPPGGVVYLEALAAGAPEDPPLPDPVGRILREWHDYPDRDSHAYGDFDRRTWTMRLGEGGHHGPAADAKIGVAADQLPRRVAVTIDALGPLAPDGDDRLLAIRIDYADRQGSYARSILFHGPLGGIDLFRADGRPSPLPWGTGQPADETVAVPDLHRFTIDLARRAPADWNGRALITATLRAAGPEARVRITFRAAP